MKKTIFLILILFIHFDSAKIITPAKKINRINKIERIDKIYTDNFEKIIAEIKIREGYRANIYDDFGYECIGYGQRLKFFNGKIPVPLSEMQADSILRISYNKHIDLCKRYCPKSKRINLMKIAQKSYYFGIKKALQMD